MRLYLAQEGCLDEKSRIPPTASVAGRKHLERVTSFLARGYFDVSGVVHLNTLGCQETAIILSNGLGVGRIVHESPELVGSNESVSEIYEIIQSSPKENT